MVMSWERKGDEDDEVGPDALATHIDDIAADVLQIEISRDGEL